MTDFEKIVKSRKTGEGICFGGASRRFDYHPCKRKQGQFPSPADYSSSYMQTRKGQQFHKDNTIREAICTFGESRNKMYRLHVDQIYHSSDAEHPAPGSHQKFVEWINPKDHSVDKTTPLFSMR